MSDLTFPPPNAENVELAAANRRLTTAILGMTLLTGLVACLSYLAGRTVTHMRAETAVTTRAEVPAAPVVIKPLAQKPSPSVTALPAAVPVPPPVPAGSYLQVGLSNPAVDRSLEDLLAKRGYAVLLAPMENSPLSRVLVGPIQTAAQQQELQRKLQSEGYQFFPRRY